MCKKENSQLDEHFGVRSNLKSIQSLLTFVSMYFAFHMYVYVYVFVLIADIYTSFMAVPVLKLS